MTDPVWVHPGIVLAMHESQLAEHGGAPGLRDEGLLGAALARPRHRHAYGETEICALAAAYAFGIVRNHPFIDGNKRTALLATFVFLRMNGWLLVAPEADAAAATLALADGEMDEAAFAGWLRRNSVVSAD